MNEVKQLGCDSVFMNGKQFWTDRNNVLGGKFIVCIYLIELDYPEFLNHETDWIVHGK